MQRERTFIDSAVWETILTKYVVPYKDVNSFCPPTLIPHKDGESLLNKNFAKLLKRASEVVPDMKLDLYSHGLLLPAWAKRGEDFFEFIRTLPNKVRYLMSYHPFNHDDSVNDYTATNAYMRKVLANPPSNVEFIMVAHVSRQSSQATLDNWRETWQPEIKRGVLTVHTNASINPWTGKIKDQATCEYNGCPYSDFGHWFFGVTGNVIACCLDLEEEIVLGNVMVDEPQRMFDVTAEFYAEQRRILADKSRLTREVCRDCFGMGCRKDLVQIGGMA